MKASKIRLEIKSILQAPFLWLSLMTWQSTIPPQQEGGSIVSLGIVQAL